ncbi:MAG: hypothetical protein ACOY0T_07590 [Myxococcota bacterium]
MTDTRLQRLEALLARVRRRSGEARARTGSVEAQPAVSAPVSAPVTAPREAPPREAPPREAIATAPPPPASLRAAPAPSAPRSLPVQAPESGWPEAPPPEEITAVGARVSETSVLEVVDNPPLETLGEDDLLEIPSDMLESVPPSGGVEAREEEPPASSQRPKAAHLDDLESATAALTSEDGREVPIKTPPPESGPQAAPPPSLGVPPPVDMDQLLEADLMPPPVAASAGPLATPFDSLEQPFGSRPPPPASGPTVEQLGQTIDLEEAPGPELELDRPLAPPTPPPPDELEASLSAPQSGGPYAEVSLAAAPALHTMPAAREGLVTGDVAPSAPTLAELVQRPPLSSSGVMSISGSAVKAEPRTFLQLLDASIALGS